MKYLKTISLLSGRWRTIKAMQSTWLRIWLQHRFGSSYRMCFTGKGYSGKSESAFEGWSCPQLNRSLRLDSPRPMPFQLGFITKKGSCVQFAFPGKLSLRLMCLRDSIFLVNENTVSCQRPSGCIFYFVYVLVLSTVLLMCVYIQ